MCQLALFVILKFFGYKKKILNMPYRLKLHKSAHQLGFFRAHLQPTFFPYILGLFSIEIKILIKPRIHLSVHTPVHSLYRLNSQGAAAATKINPEHHFNFKSPNLEITPSQLERICKSKLFHHHHHSNNKVKNSLLSPEYLQNVSFLFTIHCHNAYSLVSVYYCLG